jgi:hypothetical protein
VARLNSEGRRGPLLRLFEASEDRDPAMSSWRAVGGPSSLYRAHWEDYPRAVPRGEKLTSYRKFLKFEFSSDDITLEQER